MEALMRKKTLREIARRYIEIIQAMERTSNKSKLIELEEQRIIWHNKFIEAMKQEGIPFKDRENVTRIAYRLAEEE
jgi:hypothetical protein